MSVGGNDSDGRRPLVVLLVELLVEAGLVEQPVRRRQGGNKTALALHFFHSQTLINHGFKENQSLDNLPFPFCIKIKSTVTSCFFALNGSDAEPLPHFPLVACWG